MAWRDAGAEPYVSILLSIGTNARCPFGMSTLPRPLGSYSTTTLYIMPASKQMWVWSFEWSCKETAEPAMFLSSHPSYSFLTNSVSIRLTLRTKVSIGAVFSITLMHSFAMCEESLTTPAWEANSPRPNFRAPAYLNTDVARDGRNASNASHASEYLPGFSHCAGTPNKDPYPLPQSRAQAE